MTETPKATDDRSGAVPLVGRRAELETLASAIGRAFDGEPQVVLVSGPAGIGKTRLLAELPSLLPEGAVALRGQCVDVAELAWNGLVGVFRRLPPSVRSKRADDLVQLLLSGSSGEETSTFQILESLLAVLGRMAREAPIALCLEDVHWADQSTWAAIEYLARNLFDERVLIVLTHRDDERGQEALRRGRWHDLSQLAHVKRMRLAPLSRDEVDALFTSLTGSAPVERVGDRLFERAGGNPFHTRELIDADPEAADRLPEDLKELLLSQLETLDQVERGVLDRLAIVSRPSDPALLTRRASDEGAAEGALRRLLEAQFIEKQEPEGRVEFRHALLREAIVSNLLPGERQAIHADIARVLEDAPELARPGALDRELATHWLGAGHRETAHSAAQRDAALATQRGAHAEAASAWEMILETTDDEKDRSEIHRRIAEAAARASDYERAVREAKQVVELARLAGDVEADTVARVELGFWRYLGGDPRAGYQTSHEAQPDVDSIEAATTRVRLRTLHAMMCTGTGRRSEAFETVERARSEADPNHDAGYLAQLMACEGNLHCQRGEIEKGPALLLDCVDPLCASGHHDDAATGLSRAAEFALVLGELQKGLEIAERGIAIGRSQTAGRRGSRLCTAIVAQAAYRMGNWSRLAEADVRQRIMDRAEGFAAPVRALVALEQKDFGSARAEIERAHATGARGIPSAHAILAEAELAEREVADLQSAFDFAREKIEDPDLLFQSQVGSHLCARALLLGSALEKPPADLAPFAEHLENCANLQRGAMGRLSARTEGDTRIAAALREDDLARRCALFADLLEHYRRIGLRVEATRALVLLARWRIEAGERRDAASDLAVARKDAVEIGMMATEEGIEAVLRNAGFQEEESASPGAVAAGLTAREITVLRLLVERRSNREIGQELFISPKTASVHVTNLLRKLEVSNRQDAAAVGLEILD